MKYYVLQIDGTWKEIPKSEIKSYLDYGCIVEGRK